MFDALAEKCSIKLGLRERRKRIEKRKREKGGHERKERGREGRSELAKWRVLVLGE